MAHHASCHEFEDYWNEFKNIESDKEREDSEDELSKTPDEGELEANWLKDAGYGDIVTKVEDGRELTDEDLDILKCMLTRQQAAVVQKRVDTLTASRTKKSSMKTDVRDIFNQNESLPIPHSPVSPSSPLYPGLATRPLIANYDSTDSNSQRRMNGANKNRYFMKKGAYSMSGFPDVLQNTSETGIEMLGINPKKTWNKWAGSNVIGKVSHLPTIDDQEASLAFREDYREMNTTDKDNFPYFILERNEEGLTQIGDLSYTDLSHLRSLALIELTHIFDANNIIFSRRKGKKRTKDHGLFGVPLKMLVEFDQKKDSNTKVPLVFKEIISYLKKEGVHTEGILRVPGATGRVKHLRAELEEEFYQGSFDWNKVWTNDAATLMKQFIREVPSALLTHEYMDAFAQVQYIPGIKQQLRALNSLIILLPEAHRETLKLLLEFLKKVVKYENENKMSLSNVAMIMAPNLFFVASSRLKSKLMKDVEISMAAGTSCIVKMLIKYHNILWAVHPYMVRQVRQHYEMEQQKKYKNKLRLTNKRERPDMNRRSCVYEAAESQDFIQISAPHLSMNCVSIHLDETMTVGDTVTRFYRTSHGFPENGRDSHSGHHLKHISRFQYLRLYETGGNIGKRCLDPKANMMTVYRINPFAEWIIG